MSAQQLNTKTTQEEERTVRWKGPWAYVRATFLKREKPEMWKELVETKQADEYLKDIEEKYEEKAERLMNQLMEQQGATWIGIATHAQMQMNEILEAELRQ